MKSKKTTTITFRIEEALKKQLEQMAEIEDKTITDKAKGLIIEGLNLKPQKTFTDEVKNNVSQIDKDLNALNNKLTEAVNVQDKVLKNNGDLLKKYNDTISRIEKTNDVLSKTVRSSNTNTFTNMIILVCFTSIINLVLIALMTGFFTS